MNNRIVPYVLLLLLASTAPAYARIESQPMAEGFGILQMIFGMIAIHPVRHILPYLSKKPARADQWHEVVLASTFLVLFTAAYSMMLAMAVYNYRTTAVELINIYVLGPILFTFLAHWSLSMQARLGLYIRAPKPILLSFAASIFNIFCFVIFYAVFCTLLGFVAILTFAFCSRYF